MGLFVGVMGLVLGFFTKTVQATSCRIGSSCTYYFQDGSTGNGSCGQNQNPGNDSCVCSFSGFVQNQSACGAPPAP